MMGWWGGGEWVCVLIGRLVGYSQQARRWPVPALAMVPRRGAVRFRLLMIFNVFVWF